MSSSQSKFVKQVLLEEGEYERLRQQQFRQYSPELWVMAKLQDQIVSALMDKYSTLNKSQTSYPACCSASLNKRRRPTLLVKTAVKNVTVLDASRVEAVKQNSTKVEPTTEPVTDKVGPVKNEEQPVKIAQPQNVDKLINIIGNKSQIIRRNNANELKVNGHAVLGSNFDELYAAILSPKGLENMAGMTEVLCALRQLNVESKDIASTRIKAAYESAPSRLSALSPNEQVLPSIAVKESKHKSRAPPKHKRRSTSPFEIEEPLDAKPLTKRT